MAICFVIYTGLQNLYGRKVQAVVDHANGPDKFVNVVLKVGDGKYWDGAVMYNPTALYRNGKYYLYSISKMLSQEFYMRAVDDNRGGFWKSSFNIRVPLQQQH